MGSKHNQRSVIPKSATNVKKEDFKFITKNPDIMNAWMLERNNASVFVSIRFLQFDYQCFSAWEKQEMRSFWRFLEKLHTYTWQQVLETSRKADKSGFSYTVIPKDKYPESEFKKKLDPQIDLFELRVDQGKRVHGFRIKSVFYLCWLDKNHKICA